MQKYPMTVEGEKALRDELKQLKTVERPKVIQDIADAREHGDLKENAEYHAAREQQGFIEGRIKLIIEISNGTNGDGQGQSENVGEYIKWMQFNRSDGRFKVVFW